MSKGCPTCLALDLPDQSRFCLSCGADLEGVAAHDRAAMPSPYTPEHLKQRVLTTRTALEGERKLVTVLMADVVDSLASAHSLDIEDIHAVMNGFFDIALEVIHAEEGTINQFRGDGFMALFGAPLTRGDEPLRALRAALEIRKRAASYAEFVQESYGVPFVWRIGVHTGTVWVGAIGSGARLDYTAEGPTVGLAARVEQVAEPGQILLTEQVAERAASFFELRDAGVREFRGVPHPVAVFELLGAGPHEDRMDAERMHGLTPFVGRTRELIELQTLRKSVPSGGALWLEIRGEAGIGKSRLAFELLRGRVDPQSSAASREHASAGPGPGGWLEGRCHEVDAARAYTAWSDLVRRAGAVEGARAETLERAQRLLSGEAGASSTEEIEAGIRDLLTEVFQDAPATVLFEDSQWMDDSSQRLVGALLRNPPTGGICFLATSRPEGAIRWGPKLPNRCLPLSALELRESVDVARCLLDDMVDSAPLISIAVERGAGNPLFIEELARSLHDGSEELRRAARLEMELRRSEARVPDTLQGVIAARIDDLPDPAKRLLQTAAVLARPFGADLLESIDPEAGRYTRPLLEELVARRLLSRSGDEIGFRHVLFREVAYKQLLRGRRRTLHRRCAEALERLPSASSAEGASQIGVHYDQAGQVDQATCHLEKAGRAYLRQGSGREACTHLRRSWELLRRQPEPDTGALTEVGLALASALNLLDRAGESAAVLESLEDAHLDGADRLRVARICIASGWVRFSELNDLERGRDLIERGVALADSEPGGLRIAATGQSYLIRVHHLDGNIERSVSLARGVAEAATAAGERFGVVFGLGNEGYVYCDAGEVARGHALCQQAADLASEDPDNVVASALAQAWLSKALVFLGDADGALRAADRAREEGERSGQVSVLYNAEVWAGEAHLLAGRPRRAAECFERLTELNARWLSTWEFQARGCLELGRYEEAAQLATRCLEAGPPRLVKVRALRTLGLALGLSKPAELQQGEARLGEAVSMSDELGLRPHLAMAYQAFAELCAARGQHQRMAYYADRAFREWEQCGMKAHAELGRSSLDAA